jgi:LmbE family N-acetylglucosaminyl deacetylase
MADIVLSILAHPDDAEMLCAGTLIRLARERQAEIHIATMTAGDCGSATLPPEEIARIRRGEGAAAAARIGATYHCVGRKDLRVNFDDPTLDAVVMLLRQVRPTVVLTHSPHDYHLDHEMTSLVVRGATFAAPIPNFLRGMGEVLDHIPHLYYCDPIEGKDKFGERVPPSFVVDVAGVIDEKAEMLACHASQREWLQKHHGIDQYLIAMREWTAKQGEAHGLAYAEGYRQHLGHSYPQDNVLKSWVGRS